MDIETPWQTEVAVSFTHCYVFNLEIINMAINTFLIILKQIFLLNMFLIWRYVCNIDIEYIPFAKYSKSKINVRI